MPSGYPLNLEYAVRTAKKAKNRSELFIKHAGVYRLLKKHNLLDELLPDQKKNPPPPKYVAPKKSRAKKAGFKYIDDRPQLPQTWMSPLTDQL